jgi:hypothetical protein
MRDIKAYDLGTGMLFLLLKKYAINNTSEIDERIIRFTDLVDEPVYKKYV